MKFFFVLVKSYSILSGRHGKRFIPVSLQITYLITLSLEKEIIVLEKVWKKSGILDEKSVRTLCKWPSLSSKIIKFQKSCYHENLTSHLSSLLHVFCVTEY